MTSSDAPAHLLSLKVMRLSRPSLSSSWSPFYSSSPSFSAHSTSSITSLQGKTPLPGYPKTLRDLTSATELLTLPSSFGNIQLGETFSSCLCVNNESKVEVGGVKVKVEMQTVTTKVVLAEFSGSKDKQGEGGEGSYTLAAGDTLENVVHHEIKELGQHVLACTVSYNVPNGGEMTFRKFYKFGVANPLSVKTKVHAPKSPSALMSTMERDKLFLEVHIQNMTAEPIWFERMAFEPMENWNAKDINVAGGVDSTSAEEVKQQHDSSSTALIQPQDVWQYIYVLTPKTSTLEPVVHAPGTIIPLGRLDISWRSSFGEPGRLLTSMLSRRIPLITVPQAPVSALPPHLKKTVTSPQLPPSRPTSPGPTQRPGSPFRSNSRPPSVSAGRPQSPVPTTPVVPNVALPLNSTHNIETNLIVRRIPRDPGSLVVGKPFHIQFTLVLSCPLLPERRNHRLRLSLIIQHLLPPQITFPPVLPAATNPTQNPAVPFEVYSPRITSGSRTPGFSTPSPTYATFNYGLAHQKLLLASQQGTVGVGTVGTGTNATSTTLYASSEDGDHDEGRGQETPSLRSNAGFVVALPPPYFTTAAATDDQAKKRQGNVSFYGQSAIALPPVELREQVVSRAGVTGAGAVNASVAANADSSSEDEDEGKTRGPPMRLYATQDFELSFVPLQKGFATIGGLRLLLADDKFIRDDHGQEGDEEHMHVKRSETHTMKEWDVVGEVFIH
ncbi:DUF974-domain-containing protein, partial [Dendrothele bispora CBS 962.96]